jgi:predicted nucleotidyltransferase
MRSGEMPHDTLRDGSGFIFPIIEISDFCRRHHISRLALFGSRRHAQHRDDSDLDILIEFETGHVPGLGFFRIQDELSTLLGYTVDLNTPKMLSRYFRDDVMKNAEVIYVRS